MYLFVNNWEKFVRKMCWFCAGVHMYLLYFRWLALDFDRHCCVKSDTRMTFWHWQVGVKAPKGGHDAGDHPPITPMREEYGLFGEEAKSVKFPRKFYDFSNSYCDFVNMSWKFGQTPKDSLFCRLCFAAEPQWHVFMRQCCMYKASCGKAACTRRCGKAATKEYVHVQSQSR